MKEARDNTNVRQRTKAMVIKKREQIKKQMSDFIRNTAKQSVEKNVDFKRIVCGQTGQSKNERFICEGLIAFDENKKQFCDTISTSWQEEMDLENEKSTVVRKKVANISTRHNAYSAFRASEIGK